MFLLKAAAFSFDIWAQSGLMRGDTQSLGKAHTAAAQYELSIDFWAHPLFYHADQNVSPGFRGDILFLH